jgi:hypothetical protein
MPIVYAAPAEDEQVALETCKRLFIRNNLKIKSRSFWSYYTDILRCTFNKTSNKIFTLYSKAFLCFFGTHSQLFSTCTTKHSVIMRTVMSDKICVLQHNSPIMAVTKVKLIVLKASQLVALRQKFVCCGSHVQIRRAELDRQTDRQTDRHSIPKLQQCCHMNIKHYEWKQITSARILKTGK